LAFNYLNPHCWLDTVALIGAIASPLRAPPRAWFGIGVTSASAAQVSQVGTDTPRSRGSNDQTGTPCFASYRAGTLSQLRWIDGWAGATMSEVVTAIKRVTDIMGEISAASIDQSTGVAQVGEASDADGPGHAAERCAG
jgi:hypothetical protein